MKKVLCLCAVLLLPTPATAQVDFRSGNFWLDQCTRADVVACNGFLMGLLDFNTYVAAVHGTKVFCTTEGVIISQLRAIVVKNWRDKPEGLHLPATVSAIVILKTAFPCS